MKLNNEEKVGLVMIGLSLVAYALKWETAAGALVFLGIIMVCC